MHDLMGDDAAKMPEAVKGAALTCILSDTLEFRSPTTTAHDKAVAESWQVSWASTSPNTPPKCLPPNLTFPPSPMRN